MDNFGPEGDFVLHSLRLLTADSSYLGLTFGYKKLIPIDNLLFSFEISLIKTTLTKTFPNGAYCIIRHYCPKKTSFPHKQKQQNSH